MARRTYTREFKLQVVQAVESGVLRPTQACRQHQLAESVLTTWRHEFRLRGEAAFTPLDSSTASASADQRIAELERLCGQLALENSVLKKALQLAQEKRGSSS